MVLEHCSQIEWRTIYSTNRIKCLDHLISFDKRHGREVWLKLFHPKKRLIAKEVYSHLDLCQSKSETSLQKDLSGMS